MNTSTKSAAFLTVAEQLARCLGCRNLAACCSVDTSTRGALDELHIWQACLKLEVPQVRAGSGSLSDGRRNDIMQNLKQAFQSNVACENTVTIDDAKDAKQFANVLCKAQSTAASHLANGGGFAHVAVVNVRFGHGQFIDISEISFDAVQGARLPELPAGKLRLKLGLLDQKLYAKASYSVSSCDAQNPGALQQRAEEQAGSLRLHATVTSVSRGFSLSYRSLPLDLGNSVQCTKWGMWNASPDRLGYATACIITIMDGESPTFTNGANMCSALALDRVKR
eukprot:TRINITY_DN10458_c0_g2_i1.p1 TRINITY_DN10458_c0_g2~~TRINITY_DN10458_c0_g2_i1.p1  ORF type:complete len:281 (+),score=54.19 TRINITY_DN10458_c0_g2_i1:59-901(+)